MRILKISLILLLAPTLAFSQWDTTGDNSTTGNLIIGSDVTDSYSMFKIQGPNSPAIPAYNK